MFAQTWIESLNMVFGTPTVTTGIIVSFITLICLDVLLIIGFGKNRNALEILIIGDFVATLLLIVFQWLPTFVGGMIAFVFALFGAWIITGGKR